MRSVICQFQEEWHYFSVPWTHLNNRLEPAIGYFELGMVREALLELDALPPEIQGELEALELRSVAYQQLGQWEAAAKAFQAICQLPSADVDRFIDWGCCLYELGAYLDCRLALLSAPPKARDNGLWNFHLACYEALLDKPDEAKKLVRQALSLDSSLQPMARGNKNLAPFLID